MAKLVRSPTLQLLTLHDKLFINLEIKGLFQSLIFLKITPANAFSTGVAYCVAISLG